MSKDSSMTASRTPRTPRTDERAEWIRDNLRQQPPERLLEKASEYLTIMTKHAQALETELQAALEDAETMRKLRKHFPHNISSFEATLLDIEQDAAISGKR